MSRLDGWYDTSTSNFWDRSVADWFHLTAVYQVGSTAHDIKLYINGQINMKPMNYLAQDAPVDSPGSGKITLGLSYRDITDNMIGTFQIDDLKIWNGMVLNDMQIQYLFENS